MILNLWQIQSLPFLASTNGFIRSPKSIRAKSPWKHFTGSIQLDLVLSDRKWFLEQQFQEDHTPFMWMIKSKALFSILRSSCNKYYINFLNISRFTALKVVVHGAPIDEGKHPINLSIWNKRQVPVDRQGTTAIVFSPRRTWIFIFVAVIAVWLARAHLPIVAKPPGQWPSGRNSIPT